MKHAPGMRQYVECVVFIIIREGHILVEHRRLSAKVAPGLTTLPGGHIQTGESQQAATMRELREELAIVPESVEYICSLIYRGEELQKLHFYWIPDWQGDMQCHEAESIEWLPLERLDRIDVEVDRVALSEWKRLYG